MANTAICVLILCTAASPAGPRQILVEMKVCEVSRTRMKELGLDLPQYLGQNAPSRGWPRVEYQKDVVP